jgi:C4-dicarboxylate-specific signal transduction histidine kinase
MRAKNKSLTSEETGFNAILKTDFDRDYKINIIPQDIGRVLLNLYYNAFYAVTEKENAGSWFEPMVTVKTNRTGNKILISVKDNGNGIPKQVMGKIFQPFFTTKPSGREPAWVYH